MNPQFSKNYNFLNDDPLFDLLPEVDKQAIRRFAEEFSLSFQECRKLVIMSRDFQMWECPPLHSIPIKAEDKQRKGKDRRQWFLAQIEAVWTNLKHSLSDYREFKPASGGIAAPRVILADTAGDILGDCPVASEKTRCCNLKTLDAVMSCAYDCSYCSIQSFYNEGKITFHRDFAGKLNELKLDPERDYHIGTGQGSDSLIWGNRNGLLDNLCRFAEKYPRVILEMKTKSANIDYFLNNQIPKNIILTWSLNPQRIIDSEETGTASLQERIEAADKVSTAGMLIGFHFHPMFHYKDWKREYLDIADELIRRFDTKKPVMISMGTLTYSKKVIQRIRERPFYSRVLQMPLENIAGKYSYPFTVKREMFQTLFEGFSQWHKKVFFYLCMEDIALWQDVFSFHYKNNDQFENEMIKWYKLRIQKN